MYCGENICIFLLGMFRCTRKEADEIFGSDYNFKGKIHEYSWDFEFFWKKCRNVWMSVRPFYSATIFRWHLSKRVSYISPFEGVYFMTEILTRCFCNFYILTTTSLLWIDLYPPFFREVVGKLKVSSSYWAEVMEAIFKVDKQRICIHCGLDIPSLFFLQQNNRIS